MYVIGHDLLPGASTMSIVKLLAPYCSPKSAMADCTESTEGCTRLPALLIMFIHLNGDDTVSA
jgi:hypothetical protein